MWYMTNKQDVPAEVRARDEKIDKVFITAN